MGILVWGCGGIGGGGEHTQNMGGDSVEWSMKRERKKEKIVEDQCWPASCTRGRVEHYISRVYLKKKQKWHTCDT